MNKKKRQGARCALVFFLFSALTIISPSKSAHAGVGQHAVGLGFGQVLLMGNYGKSFSNGLGFDLFHDYEASPMFGILTDLSFSSHSDTTGLSSLSLKGLTPNMKINFAFIDKLVIYGLVGMGLFIVNETINEQSAVTGTVTPISASGLTLGFDVGAGLMLNLDPHFGFGARLSFYNIFDKTDSSTVAAVPPSGISVGGTYVGLFLNAMYIF